MTSLVSLLKRLFSRQRCGMLDVVAVTNGKLDLGPWKQVFYGEFDGKRRKRVLVKIIGEKRRGRLL